MAYNDNQYFYAALYMTEALPGARAFTDEICARYKMPYMPMDPPQLSPGESCFSDNGKRLLGLMDVGVTSEACTSFFDTLYREFVSGKAKQDEISHGTGTYIKLTGYGDSTNTACPILAKAMDAAGLPHDILIEGTFLYLQSTGQIFTAGKQVEDLAYPGRPADPCKTFTVLSYNDLENGRLLSFVHEYRVVQAETDKEYTLFYTAKNGQKVQLKDTCRKGNILLVDTAACNIDLKTLTDEQIIAGLENTYPAYVAYAKEHTPGYTDPTYKYTVEATDDARIVRVVSKPSRFFPVEEHIRFGYGSAFCEAFPGDMVYCALPNDFTRVITRESLERGTVKLRPIDKAVLSSLPERKL